MPSPQDYLSKEELRHLYAIDGWSIARAAVFTWGCIAAALWAWAYTDHWAVLAAVFVIVATRQHALHNLVHEASHYSISRNHDLNDWLSDIFFAAPHLISTDGYRQKHVLHHAHLGDPLRDTEARPRSLIRRGALLKHTALALCGYAALTTVLSYRPAIRTSRAQTIRHALLVLGTNGVVFAYCAVLGVPLAYCYLWLLPLFTLTLYLDMLRVLAEHQPLDYAAAGVENVDGAVPAYTRSIPAGAIERFIFGPVNFCYHNEHHMLPGIPFRNLPALHRLLRGRGFYTEPDDRLGHSYLGVLARLAWPAQSASVLAPEGATAEPDR
jgi:fatty acid desaturase